MADQKLSIFNRAMTLAGNPPVSSLDGATDPMVMTGLEHYESIIAEEIENGAFRFATKSATPTLLTAEAEEPLKYQWQKPSDCLSLQVVNYSHIPLDGKDYALEGDVVRCRYNTDITFGYLFRPDEESWPERFTGIIVRRLQAVMVSQNGKFNDALQIEDAAAIKAKIARHTESKQRANRPVGDGSIVNRRRGYVVR